MTSNIDIPWLAFVTRADPDFQRAKRRDVEYEMSNGRTFMADPGLVVLDEPAAGLDAAGRELLVAQLARLAARRDSPPMVLVTHHTEEIPPNFSHVLLLRKGRVLAAGELERTLTEENIRACIGLQLSLERRGGRWFSWLAAEGT